MTMTTDKLFHFVRNIAHDVRKNTTSESIKILDKARIGDILTRNAYITSSEDDYGNAITYVAFEYSGIKTAESLEQVKEEVSKEAFVSTFLKAFPGSEVDVYYKTNDAVPEIVISIYRYVDDMKDDELTVVEAISQFQHIDYSLQKVAERYNDTLLISIGNLDELLADYQDEVSFAREAIQEFNAETGKHADLYGAYLLGVHDCLNSPYK